MRVFFLDRTDYIHRLFRLGKEHGKVVHWKVAWLIDEVERVFGIRVVYSQQQGTLSYSYCHGLALAS